MFLRRVIIAIAACSGSAIAQPFQYDLQVDRIVRSENPFTVEACLRVAGEPYTRIRLSTSAESPIRRLFDRKRTADDLEYSYFRIQTKEKIPMALPLLQWPYLDIITKEVMQDISRNEEHRRMSTNRPAWDGHLNPYPLDDTSIISASEISQNDFLGIKPKVVIPQEK